jgi:hypothetical protein
MSVYQTINSKITEYFGGWEVIPPLSFNSLCLSVLEWYNVSLWIYIKNADMWERERELEQVCVVVVQSKMWERSTGTVIMTFLPIYLSLPLSLPLSLSLSILYPSLLSLSLS